MREIKFRGKNLNGKWIHGYLGEDKIIIGRVFTTKVIFENLESFQTDNFSLVVKDHAVLEDTIGQFTGIKDKNGKEIYEGDIVLQKGYNGKKIPMCVEFSCGAFIVGYHKGSSTKNTPMLINSKCEVIGNIYDNPELLEEGEK